MAETGEEQAEEILNKANIALLHAKASGEEHIQVFEASMSSP